MDLTEHQTEPGISPPFYKAALAAPHTTPTVAPTRPVTLRNILMVAPTMFFADYGCHVRILEEATSLRALGHQLRVLAYPNGRDIAGIPVRRGPGVPFNYRILVGSSRHKLYLDAMLGLAGVHEVAAHRPDIIHAHLHDGALIGLTLGAMVRRPLVFDFQGSMTSEMLDHGFLKPHSPFYRPLRALEGYLDRWPAAVMTSSRNAADLLVREFGCSSERVFPIPDSVNTTTFCPPTEGDHEAAAQRRALRQQLGIPEDRTVMVYLGLLAEYQGTSLMLHAAREVLTRRRDVHFLIMGFPNEEHYRGLAQKLEISPWCTFTGCLPYDQAPEYLRLGDIALAPKLSATEGSGKILNYMASALPTVTFDTPVSREYLGEWGVYARERDAHGYAQALLELLRHRHEWPILGAALRQRAEARFSWEQAGRLISEIYDLVQT